tara:strand:- start:22 stop:834 length:813 start_codon:yes stop_codon:yes gene_type:complete
MSNLGFTYASEPAQKQLQQYGVRDVARDVLKKTGLTGPVKDVRDWFRGLIAGEEQRADVATGLFSIYPTQNINRDTLHPSDTYRNSTEAVFELMGIHNKEGRHNVSKVMDTLAGVESGFKDIKNRGKNDEEGSSASGYYQFLLTNKKTGAFKGSAFNTALNRYDTFYAKFLPNVPVPKAFKDARKAKTPIGILSYAQQKELAFIDSYYKKGTSALFRTISEGGKGAKEAIKGIYKKHIVSEKQFLAAEENLEKWIKKTNLVNIRNNSETK